MKRKYQSVADLVDVYVLDKNSVVLIAAQDLSGHRAVAVTTSALVDYADKDTPAHHSSVLGIINTAATIGSPVFIQTQGLITEPSWNWTMDELIYLGNNGMLTQTYPTTGFLLKIGTVVDPTAIYVNIGETVELI